MPHGSTYRRILGLAIDITEFERVLSTFFKGCVAQAEQLAMDGKTMKNALDEEGQQTHIMSVVGHESKRSYTQKK